MSHFFCGETTHMKLYWDVKNKDAEILEPWILEIKNFCNLLRLWIVLLLKDL